MDAIIVKRNNGIEYGGLQEFTFIDQNDRSREAATAYQAVVRSHVMTEIRRKKRSQSKIDKETGRDIVALGYSLSNEGSCRTSIERHHLPSTPSDWASRAFDHFLQVNFQSAEPCPTQSDEPTKVTDDETRESRHVYCLQAVETTESRPSDLASTRLESPTTGNAFSEVVALGAKHQGPVNSCSDQVKSPALLGKSRVDPFRVLPIPADQDVHQLVDHYTTIIPFQMYGTRTRHPIQHRLYDVATQDPAAFHAMLAYSARQSDSMAGSHISKQTLTHASRTIRLVYERIKAPSFKCEDGLVMAVALLAFAERRFGDDVVAQQHWLALGQILKSRGGIERLSINRWLAATLYWNCLVWSGTFDRSTVTTMELPTLASSNDLATEPSVTAELTDFIADLARAQSRLLSHVKVGCKSPCLYSCSRRRAVFASNGPLYRLVNPTEVDVDFGDARAAEASTQRTASACQLPCLLYLNIVVIDYEASPELLQHYLGKLMVCIFEEGLDMDASAEHLLIKLLVGIEDSTAELTRRAHQTIRLASVIRNLKAHSRRRIHNALLETLTVPEINMCD